MPQDESTPKIHIDTDWKAQAQAEKERLARQEDEAPTQPAGEGASGPLPQGDFKALMGVLASQAIMGLGAVADRQTGKVVVDLEGARFAIDLLETLETKTKGNLGDDEARELGEVLTELRSRYIQIADLVTRQGTAVVAGDQPIPPAV